MLLPRIVTQPSIHSLPEGPERLDAVKEESLLTIARRIPPDQRSPAPPELEGRLQKAEKVLRAARRDAAMLLLPPIEAGARPLTAADLGTLAQTIALVRRVRHRVEEAERPRRQLGGEENPAAEMVRQHREDLLGWLGPRLAGDAGAEERLAEIRGGHGAGGLAEAAATLVRLCEERAALMTEAPPRVRQAAAALKMLAPMLTSLLGARPAGPEDDIAALREDLDAAFTWMLHAERRIRAAADRCFAGAWQIEDPAPVMAPRVA